MQKPQYFQNPVLPGFYPDPSICRVGADYYLVTSSFEFFPGVPIFHSRDLVHWRQLGHVLDRPSQLNLHGIADSRGIYAPTLRYQAGLFYLITTLVREGDEKGPSGNFVCTARNPAGPWSEPHWIENAPGIDPSLFFDDDGKAYCHGNLRPEIFAPAIQQQWPHQRCIWVQEFDVRKFRLVGPREIAVDAGAYAAQWGQGFCNAFEAPHIYKKDGWYYLLIASGGTGWAHAMYIFRSPNIFGPYEPGPINPIMTHRHLPPATSAIHCPGHGDLFQTQAGDWWVVFLATRPHAGFHNYLGRETFLAPVDWTGAWPVISPRTGRIEQQYPVPKLPPARNTPKAGGVRDDFNKPALDARWNFIRTPENKWWSLRQRRGHLRLKLQPGKLCDRVHPGFVGRRVQDLDFSASTVVDFSPRHNEEEAGLVLYKSGGVHFRLVVGRLAGASAAQSERIVRVYKRLIWDDRDIELACAVLPTGPVYLRIDTNNRRYRFAVSKNGTRWRILDQTYDVSCLAQVVTSGFTGIYVGLMAGSNGRKSSNYADFDWFE